MAHLLFSWAFAWLIQLKLVPLQIIKIIVSVSCPQSCCRLKKNNDRKNEDKKKSCVMGRSDDGSADDFLPGRQDEC